MDPIWHLRFKDGPRALLMPIWRAFLPLPLLNPQPSKEPNAWEIYTKSCPRLGRVQSGYPEQGWGAQSKEAMDRSRD